MINFLVNIFGRWKLQRKYEKLSRTPVALNILYMESALIVFDLSDENRYREVVRFGGDLRVKEGFSKVEMVAFSGFKEIPSFVDTDKVRVFDKKMVSLFGIPTDEFALPILNNTYDLLIDFSKESFVPTDYFLALSDAKTKVGGTNLAKEYMFDLLIDIKENQNVTEFSNQVIRYLKMINKD